MEAFTFIAGSMVAIVFLWRYGRSLDGMGQRRLPADRTQERGD